MNGDRKEIVITIINGGHNYTVKTYASEYRNLMVLLNNTIYLEGFGECGGMGRCATCLVKIAGLNPTYNSMDRNEKSTLHKIQLSDAGIRLACQVLITDALDGSVVDIFEEGC